MEIGKDQIWRSGSYKQELRPRAETFPYVWPGGAPTEIFSKLLELSKTSRVMKLIFGMQVNIDKANSCRYDVTIR